MERRTLILLLLCGVVTIADGYSNGRFPYEGVGTSACTSGPSHTSPQNSLAPVAINAIHADGTLATTYTAGETLTVTILTTDGQNMEGFLLWATENNAECSVGNWSVGASQRIHTCNMGNDCNNTAGNAVSHSEHLGTTFISATYTVPSNASGPIRFVAHIVRAYVTYWTNVESAEFLPAQPTTLEPSTTALTDFTTENITTLSASASASDNVTTIDMMADNSNFTTVSEILVDNPISNSTFESSAATNNFTDAATTEFPVSINDNVIVDNATLAYSANDTSTPTLGEILGFTTDIPSNATEITFENSTDLMNGTIASPVDVNTTELSPPDNSVNNFTELTPFTTDIDLANLTETANTTTSIPQDADFNSTDTFDMTTTLPATNLSDTANTTELPPFTTEMPMDNFTDPMPTDNTLNSTDLELELPGNNNQTIIDMSTIIPANNMTETTNLTTMVPAFISTDNETGIDLPFTTEMQPSNMREDMNDTDIFTTSLPSTSNSSDTSNFTDPEVIDFTTSAQLENSTDLVNATTMLPTDITVNSTSEMIMENDTEAVNMTTTPIYVDFNSTNIDSDMIFANESMDANATDPVPFTTDFATSNDTEAVNVTTLLPLEIGANYTEVEEITTANMTESYNDTDPSSFTTVIPSEFVNGVNSTEFSEMTTANMSDNSNDTDFTIFTTVNPIDISLNSTEFPEITTANMSEPSNDSILVSFTTVIPSEIVLNITEYPEMTTANMSNNSNDTDLASLTTEIISEIPMNSTEFPEMTTANISESFNDTDLSSFTTSVPSEMALNSTEFPEITTANMSDNSNDTDVTPFTTVIPAETDLNSTEEFTTPPPMDGSELENATDTGLVWPTTIAVTNISGTVRDYPTEGTNMTTSANYSGVFTTMSESENGTDPQVFTTENMAVNFTGGDNSITISPIENENNVTDLPGFTTSLPATTLSGSDDNMNMTSPYITSAVTSGQTELPGFTTALPGENSTDITAVRNITDGFTVPGVSTLPTAGENPTTQPKTTELLTSSTSSWPSTTSLPEITTTPTTTKSPPTTTTTTTTVEPEVITPVKTADEKNQPKEITFKLDADFDSVVGPDPVGAKESIIQSLASIMGIDPSRITNIKLTKGSIIVDFTLEPDETGSAPPTDEAFEKLTSHMDNGGDMIVNGKYLKPVPQTLTAKSVVREKEEGGLAPSTKIVLGVVFGLIGVAIIIAIIVICVRQRKSHGFLMMRAARKDYGIPLRSMDNGRNGAASNGRSNGHSNHGFTRQ